MIEYDLGFLGGGQLARMSIMAAQRMGLRCLSLDPGPATPASSVAPAIQGDLADPERIAEVFRRCARVTLENEFIPASALIEGIELSGESPQKLLPGTEALAAIQDKFRQRQAYAAFGAPTPRAVPIEGDGSAAMAAIGFPLVLKARFGGYDGKGTRYARTPEEFADHRPLWEQGGWMAEAFVPFRRELAVMVARAPERTWCFPTMETIQTQHVCDLVFPCDADARSVAEAAVEAVGGWGLFGVELFETDSGEILINEIAPRPHNSGHYTLDWGGVSQFEQHVRLTMGWPLDDSVGLPTCMANLLGPPAKGDFRQATAAALAVPGVHVHWYGKAESRPGRKMGHLNAVGPDPRPRAEVARQKFLDAWAESG